MSDIELMQQLNAHENTEWFEILPEVLQSSADRTSETKEAPSARGLILVVKVANKAGTISFVPKLQTDTPAGTITWMTVGSAIAADGTYNYLVYDSAITNSGFTAIHVTPIPRFWKLLMDYTGTPASDKADVTVWGCYIGN